MVGIFKRFLTNFKEIKIVEENGNKTTDIKESKTTELRDNKSSGENRFKTKEYILEVIKVKKSCGSIQSSSY